MELIAGLAGGGGGLTGQLVGVGGQLGSALGAATMQANSAKELQANQINYNLSQQQKALASFRQAGLPDYMYWSGGNNSQTPNSKFYVGGEDYIASSGINTNLPYYTSGHPYQQFLNMGRPSPKTNNFQSETTFSPPSQFNQTGGQTDRLGLGFGRYSSETQVKQPYNAVPPPNSLYNSKQTQTTSPMFGNFATQTPQARTRTAFAQTNVRLGGGFSNIG